MLNKLSLPPSGLIIDAFGELRDQQEQVKEDMEVRIGSKTVLHSYLTLPYELNQNLTSCLFLLSDQMLHLWHWQRLLWPDASRVWNPHLTRAQPSQLPVSAASSMMKFEVLQIFVMTPSCPPVCRFFLMYLINKDETEHTGQVRDEIHSLGSLQHFLLCRVVWSILRQQIRLQRLQ